MEQLPLELVTTILCKLSLRDLFQYLQCSKSIRNQILTHKKEILYPIIKSSYTYLMDYLDYRLPRLYRDADFYLWLLEQPNVEVALEFINLARHSENIPALRMGLRKIDLSKINHGYEAIFEYCIQLNDIEALVLTLDQISMNPAWIARDRLEKAMLLAYKM